MQLSVVRAFLLLLFTAALLILVNSDAVLVRVSKQAADLIGKMSIAIFGALVTLVINKMLTTSTVKGAVLSEPPEVPQERPQGDDARASLEAWRSAYTRLEEWAKEEIERQKSQNKDQAEERRNLLRAANIFRYAIITGILFAVANFLFSVYALTRNDAEFTAVGTAIVYASASLISAAYLAAKISRSSMIPPYFAMVSVFYVSVTSLLLMLPHSYKQWFGESSLKLFGFEFGTALIVQNVVILPLLCAVSAWLGCLIGRLFNRRR